MSPMSRYGAYTWEYFATLEVYSPNIFFKKAIAWSYVGFLKPTKALLNLVAYSSDSVAIIGNISFSDLNSYKVAAPIAALPMGQILNTLSKGINSITQSIKIVPIGVEGGYPENAN